MTVRALGPLGPAVAPAETTPAEWLIALADRCPLLLDPDSERGWFRGAALVACDPAEYGSADSRDGDALREAAMGLQAAYDAAEPQLAVALLPYSGEYRWATYRGGVVLARDGWRTWGTLDAGVACERLRAAQPAARAGTPGSLVAEARTDMDRSAYTAAVEAVREAILAGDVYVLNLTRRLLAITRLTPAELYRSISAAAPASMSAAWLQVDGSAIVSASPERFVRLVDHEIEIAPVKGTRPRGADHARDTALAEELASDAKERAEHVMIVDLERNDIGRVCEPGSVRVDPLFSLETTSYCHQMVSSVRGLLRCDATIGDILAATFPCGSITGAPKVAAIALAEKLEATPRSAYTGSLVVAVPGALDSSVLIRTAEVDAPDTHGERALAYGTGCGITVDSDAQSEWAESVLKTEPLLGSVPPHALKETCRAVRGTVPLWPHHRARLAAGGCGEAMLAHADALVAHAAAGWADAATHRARLTLVATPEGGVTVEIAQRLSSLDVVGGLLAVRVDTAEAPPLPPGPAKPATRRWWDAAHHTAELARAHQALLVDPAGLVIDGSTSALWIAEKGVLVTPPAPPAIPSVSVAFVLEHAAEAGIETRVEAVSWERFEAADEAFFTNAYGGAAPVRGRAGACFSAVKGFFDEAWA